MDNAFKRMIRPLIVGAGRSKEKRYFDDEPIIIGACPRSGTTLLLSILDAHPHIYGIQNQTYAFTVWDNGGQPIRLDRLYRQFILHKITPQKRRWCEKTPKNVQYFGHIQRYFGEKVKLIHMLRDGRDVVTSKHPRHTPDQYWVSVRRWISDVKQGLAFAGHPNVYTLKYESLVQNYESEIQNLIHFLNEDMTTEISDWFHHTAVKKSKHWANPVQNIHSNAIGKWQKPEHRRRYEEFMANDEAVELLKRLEYEL